MDLKKFIKLTFVFGIQAATAAVAGTVPPFTYFYLAMATASNGTVVTAIKPALIAGAACFVLVLFPFCLFVAAPVAVAISHFVRLTLPRILLLALVLTGPGIFVLDYQTYLSSGPDSGPPTEPYSLARLIEAFSSPSEFMLMYAIPTVSALFSAFALWVIRFRNQIPSIAGHAQQR